MTGGSASLMTAMRRHSKADLLAACLELARRYESGRNDGSILNRPDAVGVECRAMGRLASERLDVLVLDSSNRLVHRETVSLGSLNTTRTMPREIFRPAILHGGLGVILVHNHPSGNPDPSPEDVEFTAGVARAAAVLGIDLYDHCIMAGDRCTSLRERGLLPLGDNSGTAVFP